MEKYIVLHFDIKGFTLLSTQEQSNAKKNLVNQIIAFTGAGLKDKIKLNPTGDGYHIGYKLGLLYPAYFLDLIAYLTTANPKIEIKYLLALGEIELMQEANEVPSMFGDVLIETYSLVSKLDKGNVICCTEDCLAIIQEHLGADNSKSKDGQVVINSPILAKSKSGREHKLINITYLKDGVRYGVDYEDDVNPEEEEDDITYKDYRKILEAAYKASSISPPFMVDETEVKYTYFIFSLNEWITSGVLFIKNKAVLYKTFQHFYDKQRVLFPLTIIVNRRKNEKASTTDLAKTKILNKAKEILGNDKIEVFFIDEFFATKGIIPHELKRKRKIDHESDFVSPNFVFNDEIPDQSRTISKTLEEFVYDNKRPIMVLKGAGGVGKTTCLQRFTDAINSAGKDKHKTVLFINGKTFSEALSRDITEIGRFDKLTEFTGVLQYYTYKLLDTIDGEIGKIAIDPHVLNLAVSSGNFVVVLDGLDELSQVLRNQFLINDFFKNILKINKYLHHVKVVVSTRDRYWDHEEKNLDETIKNGVDVVEIKGFNEPAAAEYFNRKFENKSEKTRASLKDLKEFSDDKQFFNPYMAFLISEINKDEGPISLDSSRFFDGSSKKDFVFSNYLNRERERKYGDFKISIDDIMEIFQVLVVENRGIMSKEEFSEYLQIQVKDINSHQLAAVLDNHLLNDDGKTVSIRHDFTMEYLRLLFLSKAVMTGKQSTEIYRIAGLISDDSEEQVKEVVARLKTKDDYEENISHYLRNMLNGAESYASFLGENYNQYEIFKRGLSGLLYIFMEVGQPKTGYGTTDRTQLLDAIYIKDYTHLYIYGSFYSLDLRGKTITESVFVGYDNFTKCLFDEKTRIRDPYLILSKDTDGVQDLGKYPSLLQNWQQGNKVPEEWKEILRSNEIDLGNYDQLIKDDVKRMLRQFYPSSGVFKNKQKEHLSVSITASKINWKIILETLIDFGIVESSGENTTDWRIAPKSRTSVKNLMNSGFIDSSIQATINKLKTLK